MTFSGRNYEKSIKGYNRLMNKFRRLAADQPEIGDEPLGRWAQDTTTALKKEPYPPKRPQQRYQRTGQLANRWAVKKESAGRYQIINDARSKKTGTRYAGYVVGPKQAWMHLKRWWKANDVINRRIPELRKTLREAYEKVWND